MIPPKDLWRLEEAAEARGMSIEQFLYRAGMAALGGGRNPKDSVLALHAKKLTIPEIARRLGMTNSSVQYHLYDAGLRGNKRDRGAR